MADNSFGFAKQKKFMTHNFIFPYRLALTCIFIFICSILKAETFEITYQNNEKQILLFAKNEELYPISVRLDLSMKNLKFSHKEQRIFVIPPRVNHYKVTELEVVNTKLGYKFSFAYQFTMGNVNLKDYEKDYPYELPYASGQSFQVAQGYHGKFSHQNEKAIDFDMPEGTEILAARDGLVVEVVQHNSISCLQEDCKKFNNYIVVMHDDSTFASYAHIKFQGSKVKRGDRITLGQPIAYSGNVGWTSGPHLHFVCFTGGFKDRNSIPTVFKVGQGEVITRLQEGIFYPRAY